MGYVLSVAFAPRTPTTPPISGVTGVKLSGSSLISTRICHFRASAASLDESVCWGPAHVLLLSATKSTTHLGVLSELAVGRYLLVEPGLVARPSLLPYRHRHRCHLSLTGVAEPEGRRFGVR